MDGETCIHRGRDCTSLFPGVQVCQCGQVFVFVAPPNGAGHYKKLEEVTEEDVAHFSPEVEAELLKLSGKAL